MTITCGVVRNGQVVPNMPLEEGAFVRIEVLAGPIETDPELEEELAAWREMSAQAWDTVEQMLDEEERKEGMPDAPG
jgi:hypothetical protein